MKSQLLHVAHRLNFRIRSGGESAGQRVFQSLLAVLRRFDRRGGSNIVAKLARMIGPWLPEHRIGRANLRAAFPDKSAADLENLLHGVWDNLGRVAAEFAYLDRLYGTEQEKSFILRKKAFLSSFPS